jgi:hypothetical protein
MMDVGLAIFGSICGSAGIFGLIQFFVTRHDNKDRDLAIIKKQLRTIEKKCDRNELATTRLQLFFLVDSQPENIDAIETTAQRYFIELGGNGEAWATFHKWAETHKIDTSWYKALLAREKGDK